MEGLLCCWGFGRSKYPASLPGTGGTGIGAGDSLSFFSSGVSELLSGTVARRPCCIYGSVGESGTVSSPLSFAKAGLRKSSLEVVVRAVEMLDPYECALSAPVDSELVRLWNPSDPYDDAESIDTLFISSVSSGTVESRGIGTTAAKLFSESCSSCNDSLARSFSGFGSTTCAEIISETLFSGDIVSVGGSTISSGPWTGDIDTSPSSVELLNIISG